jgi:hypothetical protein
MDKGKKSWWTKKDFEDVDEYDGDFYQGGYEYDYGWGNSFASEKFDSKKENKSFNKSWETNAWGDKWKGYSSFKKPQLTYQYVQQMANMLAAQHKVNVVVSNTWETDLTTSTLRYNPTSLVYGTKSELLATLLHEIGKLRYSSPRASLTKQGMFKKYGASCFTAFTPFEELRIDAKMIGEYPSAPEIYESQEPALIEVVSKYNGLGGVYRRYSCEIAERVFNDKKNEIKYAEPGGGAVPQDIFDKMMIERMRGGNPNAMPVPAYGIHETTRMWQSMFGVNNEQEADAKFQAFKIVLEKKVNLLDYVAGIYATLYELPENVLDTVHPDAKPYIDKTIGAMAPCIRATSAQEVMDIMEIHVFSNIEDLLNQFEQTAKELEAFSKEFAQAFKSFAQYLEKNMQDYLHGSGLLDQHGNTATRNSGPSSDTTVPEWHNGDYKVLRDSVKGEIKSLVRKLTYLRRQEAAPRFKNYQKRGKLDMKRLYRVAMGSRNVFKRKIDIPDTVRSFAFSFVVDVSGSMEGPRMVNTTRGLIMLSEVFKQMQIPFEIVVFNDEGKTVKSFDTPWDTKLEKKLGGLALYGNSGTNLNCGLDKVTLKKLHQRNKVVVVLSDGGVGDVEEYNARYFMPMREQGIRSMAFGIEVDKYEGANVRALALGAGQVVNNAAELPELFSKMLKDLIK